MFVYPTVLLLAGYLEKGKCGGVRQVTENDRSEVIKDGRDRLRSRARKVQPQHWFFLRKTGGFQPRVPGKKAQVIGFFKD